MSRTDISTAFGLPYYQTVVDEVISTPTNPIAKPSYKVTRSQVQVGNTQSVYRHSLVTPGYPQKASTGQLKPNPFTYTAWIWKPCTGSKSREITNYPTNAAWRYTNRQTISGCLTGVQSCNGSNAQAPSLLVQNAVNACQADAVSRIKNQDANLAEAWAERHKALDMIRNAAENIGSCYRSLRRGNFLRAANVLGIGKPSGRPDIGGPMRGKKLSDAWLEYRYGWMPLILDAQGAVTALQRSFSRPKNQVCKVQAKRSLSDESVSLGSIDWGSGVKRITRRYDVDVKTVIYYRQSSGTLATLSSLGLDNPLALGWELLHYSFVIDWFFNIGTFLSNLSAGFGYEFDSGCVTVFQKSIETQENSWNGQESGLSGRFARGSSVESHSVISCNRTLLAYIPVFTLPAFENHLSVKKTIDAIALVSQHRGK